MTRKPFVCANWKLHHLLPKTLAVLQELKDGSHDLGAIDVVIAPVATVLHAACEATRNSQIRVSAQNVFSEKQGAFTGEWSVEHLRELGCSYAIVGHSERRQYFAETDQSVAQKVKACFDGKIIPIACVGESLQERKAEQVEAVLSRQIKAVISQVSESQIPEMIIAYEPIWAIGTGVSATAYEAQKAHFLIRQIIAASSNSKTAAQVRIIYGGSVKGDNVYDLAKQPDIDGALVGGASLEAASFLKIAREILRARG